MLEHLEILPNPRIYPQRHKYAVWVRVVHQVDGNRMLSKLRGRGGKNEGRVYHFTASKHG